MEFKKYLVGLASALWIATILIYLQIPKPGQDVSFDLEKYFQTPGHLTNEEIEELAQDINMYMFKDILKPILVERVVGTESHERVKDYIAGQMRNLNWNVELDSFTDTTPNRGELAFTNVIATFNPDAPRQLVFACHYDSKLMNFTFVAATDSAVPCAMLLYLGQSLTPHLSTYDASKISLKFVFFDGEEAFKEWSSKDSLYGSRHLAHVMNSSPYFYRSSNNTNHLDRIDLLVLLDLIGAPSPSFYSYFQETDKWHQLLITIEMKLYAERFFTYETRSRKTYFKNQKFFDARVSDDHEPFLDLGVPVLHLIPHPFPHFWHTTNDDINQVNFHTVENLLKILKVFIAQYLKGKPVIRTWYKNQ